MLKKIACVDIDGVLFDVELFKKDYFAIFEVQGINKDLFKTTYNAAKQEGFYNVDEHLNILKNTFPKSVLKTIRRDIESLLVKNSLYIYSDAVSFLSFLVDSGYKVVLLSTGTDWFQKAKISGSALMLYASDIIVTPERLKRIEFSRLRSSANGSKFIVVDDSPEVINALKSISPDILALQVLRKWQLSKLSELFDVAVSNLEEAKTAIIRLSL